MREASQLTFDLRTVGQLIYALFVASQLCIGVNLSLFCVLFFQLTLALCRFILCYAGSH